MPQDLLNAEACCCMRLKSSLVLANCLSLWTKITRFLSDAPNGVFSVRPGMGLYARERDGFEVREYTPLTIGRVCQSKRRGGPKTSG